MNKYIIIDFIVETYSFYLMFRTCFAISPKKYNYLFNPSAPFGLLVLVMTDDLLSTFAV